jgi:hypothetical protein
MGRSVHFQDDSGNQLAAPSVLITRTPSIQAEMSQGASCEMLINNQQSDEFVNMSTNGTASNSGRRSSIDGTSSQRLGKRSSNENASFPFSTGRRESVGISQLPPRDYFGGVSNLTGRRFSTDRRSSIDRSSVNRRSSIESEVGHRCIVTGRKMSVMSVPELPGKFTHQIADTVNSNSFSNPEIDSSDNCSIPQLPRGGIMPISHILSEPECSTPEHNFEGDSTPEFHNGSLPSLPRENPYYYGSERGMRLVGSDESLQSHLSLSEWKEDIDDDLNKFRFSMDGDSLESIKEEPAMKVNLVPPERPGSNVVARKPMSLTPMRLAPTDGPRCVSGRRLSGASLFIPPLPRGEFYINNASSPDLTPMAEAGRRHSEIAGLLRETSTESRRKSYRKSLTG